MWPVVSRIAHLHWRLLARRPAPLVMHALGLVGLVLFAVVRIQTAPRETPTIVTLVLLAASVGAPLSLGVHTLVGERARGTLEPLLLLPVPRPVLLAGQGAVVLALAIAEIAVVAVAAAVTAARLDDPSPWLMLQRIDVGLAAVCGAPLLALLMTVVTLVISGRARDAQAASTQATLVAVPLLAILAGFWWLVVAARPLAAAVAIAALLVLCLVALRAAAAWLSDDRLLSRRG